ncbi:helix-turn-helix domain-containing protein [Fluviicola taffensis]|uniref:Helix-turn-helix domain protein n=1 Tax=Fluviicola taffensis (strain DSM 16823 / NCIMB 13979 / RW262) TaxID=755732 RepID=F2IHD0_FLUTR|nr:helix-turn-helix transcriptional regulator [Fluviicola taffensis]AEA42685.1 helix-turn-helix domain protein [Fluviicola taffensis DSM 16823]
MDKNEFDSLFGEFIKQKRKSLNWTQNDLAEKINNDFQNISRLERGEVSPSIFWISELAKGFGCSLGELMTEFDAFVSNIQKIPSKH